MNASTLHNDQVNNWLDRRDVEFVMRSQKLSALGWSLLSMAIP